MLSIARYTILRLLLGSQPIARFPRPRDDPLGLLLLRLRPAVLSQHNGLQFHRHRRRSLSCKLKPTHPPPPLFLFAAYQPPLPPQTSSKVPKTSSPTPSPKPEHHLRHPPRHHRHPRPFHRPALLPFLPVPAILRYPQTGPLRRLRVQHPLAAPRHRVWRLHLLPAAAARDRGEYELHGCDFGGALGDDLGVLVCEEGEVRGAQD